MNQTTNWLPGVLVGMAVLCAGLFLYLPDRDRTRREPLPDHPSQAGQPPGRRASDSAKAQTDVGVGQTFDRQGFVVQTAGQPAPGKVGAANGQAGPLLAGQSAGTQAQQERGPGPQERNSGQQKDHASQVAGVQTDLVPQANPAANPEASPDSIKSRLRRDRPDLLAFHEGFNRLLQGNYPAAAESFERVTQGDTAGEYYDDALYWLGYSLAELGRDDEAIGRLQALVQSFPASPYADDALLKIGTIHQRLKRVDQAGQAFQDAVDKYPDSEASLSCAQNLATLEESRGNWGGAKDAWSKSDSQSNKQLGEPDNYYAQRARNRIDFIDANDQEEGGRTLELFTRGEALLADRNPKDAAEVFSSILSEFPKSRLIPAARYKAALCWRQLGEPEKALALLRRVLQACDDQEVHDAARRTLEEMEGKPAPAK